MSMMDTRKQQLVTLVIAAIILVGATITTTVVIKKSLSGDADGNGYKNVTFTDAVLTCESEVKSRFADDIKTLAVDNHSSRYDSKFYIYKIFLNANVATKKHKHGNLHYINCFVKSSNGRISKFDVFEDFEQQTEALTDKETNSFGWPK